MAAGKMSFVAEAPQEGAPACASVQVCVRVIVGHLGMVRLTLCYMLIISVLQATAVSDDLLFEWLQHPYTNVVLAKLHGDGLDAAITDHLAHWHRAALEDDRDSQVDQLTEIALWFDTPVAER